MKFSHLLLFSAGAPLLASAQTEPSIPAAADANAPVTPLQYRWISKLVVKELRKSRWHRQLIVVSHNANIPVLGDAEQVIALENRAGQLCLKASDAVGTDGTAAVVHHVGPVESFHVRNDIQSIMEGGVAAFVQREQKYNNETRAHRLMA
jgi:hypothetical protein